jgi:hypothetical protein
VFDDSLDFEAYANILDDLESHAKNTIDENNLSYDDSAGNQDMELLKNIADEDQKRKDSLYSKRSQRQSIKKRGGLRQESPFFDDD